MRKPITDVIMPGDIEGFESVAKYSAVASYENRAHIGIPRNENQWKCWIGKKARALANESLLQDDVARLLGNALQRCRRRTGRASSASRSLASVA